MYKKRTGTSGVRGQFYETKLASLILFRAQHNDSIEDFYLGTNVEGNGAFDDICLRVTLKDHSRPLIIFIQAKHTENRHEVLTLNSRNDLAKYFQSFIDIKQRFHTASSDDFFKANYNDTDCVFIIYTTQNEGKFQNTYNSSWANILNELIATGNIGSRVLYTKEDIDFLCKISLKEVIKKLATQFVKFIYNDNKDMNNELILRYHVLLAKKVVNVSDVKSQRGRLAKFRIDFFSSKDDELLLIKDKLFEEVLSRHANTPKRENINEISIEDLLKSFFSNPAEYSLSELIYRNVVTYKYGKLKFVHEMPINLVQQLEKINMPVFEIDNALILGVKLILNNFQFEVPATFGNKDLAIKGNQEKIDKRLDYLTDQIMKLFDKHKPNNIILINDKDVDAKIFRTKGGLDSAIGNLLVLDEKSKLLKFNENSPRLGQHCKALLKKLENKICNLQEYRLDVRVKNFPQLFFGLNDENLPVEFFSKLLFYTNQEDESGVGTLLKQDIDAVEGANIKHFHVKSEAIFNNFHVEVQNWWLIKKEARYLRKDCDFYQKAKASIINDPVTTVLSMMYLTEIKNMQCKFKDKPTISLDAVDLLSRNIIVTDITSLTFIKLTQSLKNDEYIVLDLKYIQHLPTSDLKALSIELSKINKEKFIIIICDTNLQRNLLVITRAVQDKNITVITHTTYTEMMKDCFRGSKITNDEGNSLFDLNKKSQEIIVKRSRAIFQGQEISLDLLVDNLSVALIKGVVLNKILNNETITISDALELPVRPIELLNYDIKRLKYEINDLYIDRRVSRGKLSSEREYETDILQTLNDLDDDIVLITAMPGMGKSTLLSFLSIKTKQSDKQLWLIRINLLDYSKHFNTWKNNKTIITTLETLTFICKVIVKNKIRCNRQLPISLTDSNGEVHVSDTVDDEWIKFELELFLHFFKYKKVSFLFDGFDEICPNYENEVLSFINCIKSYHSKHRIWITSRPYNKIKSKLQQNFEISEPYELIPFADNEQAIYFEKYFKYNLILNELNDAQLQNIKDFLQFTTDSHTDTFADNFIRVNKPQNYLLNKVYFHFMIYLQKEVQALPMDFPLNDKYKSRLNYSTGLGKYSQERYRTIVGDRGIKDMLEFVGTPLHMYLVADYFLSAIKDDSEKIKEWDLDVNTYAIYENFLESKLKKIRFEDKNKMDVHNPDIMDFYETVRKDFIDMHKKLAAFAIFHINGHEIFDKQDLNEILNMIKKIENGSEKAGLIYNISNNIPQFIHMTFAEYFAVEYISDVLKKEHVKKQEEICSFIINLMLFDNLSNILNIMDLKLKMDNEFASVIDNNKTYIYKVLISQNVETEKNATTEHSNVKSSMNEAILKNLNNFLSIFLTALEENTDKNNLDNYIQYVGNSGFLKIAAVNSYDDIILRVFKFIRKNHMSKWRTFIGNPHIYYCEDITENFRIHRLLRHHIKDYYQWSYLCNHGSFVMNNEAV